MCLLKNTMLFLKTYYKIYIVKNKIIILLKKSVIKCKCVDSKRLSFFFLKKINREKSCDCVSLGDNMQSYKWLTKLHEPASWESHETQCLLIFCSSPVMSDPLSIYLSACYTSGIGYPFGFVPLFDTWRRLGILRHRSCADHIYNNNQLRSKVSFPI